MIGGDDTLGVAIRLHNDFGIPVVGVPKTIDNDLMVTDFSFGFDTAVNIVTEAVDRLRTTTESHRRIMVVETMGRHSGWIACFAGIAVGRRLYPCSRGAHRPAALDRRPVEAPRRRQEIRHRDRRRGGQVSRPRSLHARRSSRPVRQSAPGRHRRGDRRSDRKADRARDALSSSWATSSAAGPPAPTTASWPPGWDSAASRLVLQNRFGTIVTLAGGKIVESALERQLGRDQDPRPHLLRRSRGVFSLSRVSCRDNRHTNTH